MHVIDPVCETELEEEDAFETRELNGEIFYFCSLACLNAFEEEPERFTRSAEEEWEDDTATA